MGAIDKTKTLIRIEKCPLTLLVKNPLNPNKMSNRQFDLLCDNLNKIGWTEPVLTHPAEGASLLLAKLAASAKDEVELVHRMEKNGIRLKIDGGHHRFDAATYLGFTEGPVTIIMDPAFDEEQAKFQTVRMNIIHGHLDPQAFVSLIGSLENKYTDEIMQEAFGFAEEAEFKRLTAQLAKTLPDKHLQDKFKEAAAEIKTIDGLAKLLNSMFTKYGDSLPYGFMVFDYGGQRSMWLRIENKTMNALDIIADICIDRQRTIDDVVGTVLQLIAKGDSKEFIDSIVESTKPVELPKNLQLPPTKDNIAKVEAL